MKHTVDKNIIFSSTIPKPKKKVVEADDMYNYQCSFLEYAMIIVNFFDAIKEGDGERIIRCWKFQLPYLRHDKGSTKYAVEALGLIFQVHSLLSPQDAHRLIWNRTISLRPGIGKNFPLDLSLEFMNRVLKIIILKLGPNATSHKCVDRYCRAIDVTKSVLDNFDYECEVICRSGKHVARSTLPDLEKIVGELQSQSAFKWTPGRNYDHYRNIESSILDNFDLQDLFRWINQHKRNIEMMKKAR